MRLSWKLALWCLSLFVCPISSGVERSESNSEEESLTSTILPRNLQSAFHRLAVGDPIDLKHWSLEEKIGQLLIVGYRDSVQIEKWKVGGVVLFAWNLAETIDETKKGIDRIKQLAAENLKAPLFIATDQEGGRVLRIRRGMTPFPDAAAMGEVADPLKSFLVGKYMGIELKALGLNMNFAPVLDLGGDRSFLENRTWGESKEELDNFPIHFMRGLHSSGVVAVAKHFPGHGSSEVDSHFAQPTVNKTFEEIWVQDLLPFRTAVKEGALAMMTAHVRYPKIDSQTASFSKKFLKEILREKMNYRGLVITDDLEMDGAKFESVGYGELAVRSLEAGSDMILLVWSLPRQEEVLSAIKNAVESGRLSQAWLDEKVRRILSVKRATIGTLDHRQLLGNKHWKSNLRTSEAVRLANEVSYRAIEWWEQKPESIKKSLQEHWHLPWSVYVPQHAWKRIWKMNRPQDEVKVFNARQGGKKFVEDMQQRLRFDDEPIVVLTPPRKHWSQSFERRIQDTWRSVSLLDRKKPILWIHQGRGAGAEPRGVQAGQLKNGVSLFSETFFSFRQIQSMLKSQSKTSAR